MAEEQKEVVDSKSIIDQAKEAHEQLNKSIAEYKKLIEEEAKIKSMELLGGKSTAGQTPPPVVEETPQEYARRIEKGFLK